MLTLEKAPIAAAPRLTLEKTPIAPRHPFDHRPVPTHKQALERAYDMAWRLAMSARIGRMTKAKETEAQKREAVAAALKAILDECAA